MPDSTAAPIVFENINDLSVSTNADDTVINLFDHFDDPFTTGLVARFELADTSLAGGITDVLLFDQEGQGAPGSVDNFLTYVEDGDYDNTIIHRSVPGFVVQGGGFAVNDLENNLLDPPGSVSLVPVDAPIQNEFSPERSNVRGTIAYAKQGGNPNSATSQFFFNLGDNSGNLDNQNGGFTVFGEVLGDGDLDVLDAIAALPTSDQSTFFDQGAFTDLPVIVDDPANPVIEADDDLVQFQSVVILDQQELTFEVLDNTNPALVTATILDNELTLDYQSGIEGESEITVRATNLVGEVIEDSFIVTIGNATPTTSGIDDVTVDEDSDPTTINLFDSFDDVEDGSEDLTYSILANSNQGLFTETEIDPATGDLVLNYASEQIGQAEITVQAEDSLGQTVDATFSVTVEPVNDAPVGVPDVGLYQVSSSDNSSLVVPSSEGVLNNDQDSEGDSLTANLIIPTQNGELDFNLDGSFTYTPELGFVGVDTFSYTAFDGTDNSAPTQVDILVDALPVVPDDAIEGSDASERIKGTRGSDYLVGLDGNDRLRGRSGNDTISGGLGEDNIKSHAGNDVVDGGGLRDLIKAGSGNDTVFGGTGDDLIRGQKGNDLLVGGEGNDFLRGGKNNDTLNGGIGNDTLRGGRGRDTYVLEANGGVDVFENFKINRDVIELDDGLTLGALTFERRGKITSILADVNGGSQLIAIVQQNKSANLSNPSNFIEPV